MYLMHTYLVIIYNGGVWALKKIKGIRQATRISSEQKDSGLQWPPGTSSNHQVIMYVFSTTSLTMTSFYKHTLIANPL